MENTAADQWGYYITYRERRSSITNPYCCPVCGGRGMMPESFYNFWLGSGTVVNDVPCRACGGKGIVWQEANDA